jgi:hypothetical protein
MNLEHRSVVWILGAGFSKSLGAPLLSELLTLRSAQRVEVVYQGQPFLGKGGRDLEAPAAICEAGIEEGEWEHAEEFLERLDLAVSSDSARRILAQYFLASPAIEKNGIGCDGTEEEVLDIRARALRLLAGELCLFLKDADPEMEKWAPYRKWASMLAPNDTVITFNYDRVLDLLVPFGTDMEIVDPIEAAHWERKGPLVLKLHGSINWFRDDHGKIGWCGEESKHPDESGLYCKLEEMALATPGPTKQSMIREGGSLKALWDRAGEQIGRAHAVVMVGYRMPPTDAGTKQWLVDEIRERVDTAPSLPRVPLHVHTVLGYGDPHGHSQRLSGLLANISTAGLRHKAWPMNAEDFLGLVQRETLLTLPSVEDMV